ncbi:MAG: MBG domain-containing protein, partial [Chthoniobacterales bacterium]
ATATAAAYSSANAGSYSNVTITYSLANGTNGGLAANYSLANGSATGSVTAKALSITANNVTKTYGAALTGGAGSAAFTSSGLVGSETIGSVTITYTGTPSGASASDAATTYSGTVVPSSPTGGTFTAGNYSITYNNGNVTVNKAVLTATAGNQTVVSGTAASTVTGNGTVTYSGFVNSENSSVVSGSVTYTTTYTSSDAAGTAGRTITPVVTGLSAANYTFSAANGTISVVAPNYGLRDDNGSNLPTLTYWYAGAPNDVTQKGAQFATSLGTISSLYIKDVATKTWKSSGGNVTGTRFESKVWETAEAEPDSYTTRSVGFTSNDESTTTLQTWSDFGAEIDIFSALGSNYGN